MFDGVRKGKYGHGATSKTAIFRLIRCNAKVYTAFPNTQSPFITGYSGISEADSIVYTDFYRSYDMLDVSKFNHFRISHSTHFAEKENHINRIGNFQNRAKQQ
ncbi:transposase [Neisseria iguanae]|uniref:transposase n=1 Tax=Neisseria iguanae TaxID=90242 RepID=UPI000D0F0267